MAVKSVRDCWSAEEHQQMVEFASANLWRFIQHNATPYTREQTFLDITGLSQRNLTKLCDIYFLLTDEVEEFVNETAPAILNKLSKSSLSQTTILRGKIKGKVSWPKTLTTRYISGGDKSLFVCQHRSSIFDLPENRVLLFVLKQILRITESILGTDLYENYELDNRINNNKWIDIVKMLAVKCSNLLRNPYVREISDIYDLTEKNIQETQKARGSNYTQLALTARILNDAQKRKVDFLYDKLANKILMPLNRDVLYELSVLFKILEHARNSGWTETKANLIGGGSKYISKFLKHGTTMKIYYQSIPSIFIKNSKYKDLMNYYHIDVGYRRPDIIIEWVKENGQKRYCIVEVKRSKDHNYLIDGLYKLLGYLKDFEDVFVDSVDSKGVLVGWDSNSKQLILEKKEFYFAGWNNFSDHLNVIEKNVLADTEILP